MDYGRFSEDGREYIITRPDTPRPWTNCLANSTYTAIVSHTGGGYSFVGGPGYDRITRAYPDTVDTDRPGRYVFVRDNDTGEYFSIGWQPTMRTPDWFECRHAPGVTTVASINLGIAGRITYFVPIADSIEVWRVRIENRRDRPADLSVFTYVEWVLGNYTEDLEEREESNLFNEAGFQDNYIFATKRAWRRPDTASVTLREMKPGGSPKFLPETVHSNQTWGKYAFIALSVPVHRYDCDRRAFLGRRADIGRPEVVERGECTNSDGDGRDAVGVLQTRFTIASGETANFDVFLGVTLHRDDPSGIVARYSESGEVDARLDAVRSYWDAYIQKVTVSTPDTELNRAVNIWDKYQNWVSAKSHGIMSLARNGSSVVGFRESCYDVFGVLPMDPDYSKLRTVELVQHQHRDGSAIHRWELRSDVGASAGHLDDPIWLVFAVTNYIKETGDFGFLDERVKYYYSQRAAAVYEHLVKALDFCLSRMSPRGLSLLGPGDWNEALDEAGVDGRGESMLTSMMLAWALGEAAQVARLREDHARRRYWRTREKALVSRLNELAWDGEWYTRAATDRGDMLGASGGSVANIYLNPQTWAVISGVATGDRGARAMDGALDRLDTDYGAALLIPAYRDPNRLIGLITRFAPGSAENGGIFTLAGCWAIIAACMLGRGAAAYEIFRKSMYFSRAADADRYEAEPYVHAEHVLGPDSSGFGRGMFTWDPGVAAWMWRTCIDWICGVRPDYLGLRVDPCVPPDWKEFSVIRPYRDAVYRITVRNPDGVERGVRQIVVDGKKFRGKLPLPDFRDRAVHDVEVTMGQV